MMAEHVAVPCCWKSCSCPHPPTTPQVATVSSHLFAATPAHTRHLPVHKSFHAHALFSVYMRACVHLCPCVRACEGTHLAVGRSVGGCQQLAAQLVHEGGGAGLGGARLDQSLDRRTLYGVVQEEQVAGQQHGMLASRNADTQRGGAGGRFHNVSRQQAYMHGHHANAEYAASWCSHPGRA
jgi:hypothetical protein